jgi:hypothetical protein
MTSGENGFRRYKKNKHQAAIQHVPPQGRACALNPHFYFYGIIIAFSGSS